MENAEVLKREVNRRRREDGYTADVPAHVWQSPAVRGALDDAVKFAQSSGLSHEEPAFSVAGPLDVLLKEVQRAINAHVFYEPPAVPIEREAFQPDNPQQIEKRGLGKGEHEDPMMELMKNAFDDYDRVVEGGEAAAEFLAWHMNQETMVVEYRRDVLGGAKPTEEEAWEFLTSSLPRVLSLKDYAEMGRVPLTTTGFIVSDMVSELLFEVEAPYFGSNSINLGEQGILPWWKPDVPEDAGDILRFEVEVTNPSGEVHRKTVMHRRDGYEYIGADPLAPLLNESDRVFRLALPPIIRRRRVPFFVKKDGSTEFVQGMRGSVTSEALRVANSLAARYPVDLWDALQFLLTGEAVALEALYDYERPYRPGQVHVRGEEHSASARLLFSAHGSLAIYVQPWVTPECLAKYWYFTQDMAVGRRPSPPLKHNLDLFRFVLRHTPPGERFRWQKLCHVWEKEQGRPITRNAMQMTFKRVQETLFPDFTEGSSR